MQCGRTFLRRLFQLLSVARRPHHHIRLNDIRWWDRALSSHSKRCSTDKAAACFMVVFASDMLSSVGCGAVWPPNWLQLKWSQTYTQSARLGKVDSIAYQELLPIVLACAVWGDRWRNASVRVFYDNMAIVAIVNSGYSRVTSIMHLIRCLFFIRVRFNLHLEATHIPGALNHLANADSCDNIAFLFSRVSAAPLSQTPIPPQLVSLLVVNRIDWTSPDWSQQFGTCFLQAWPHQH